MQPGAAVKGTHFGRALACRHVSGRTQGWRAKAHLRRVLGIALILFAAALRRWFSIGADVRNDAIIAQEVLESIDGAGAKSVIMTDRIIGCPHEEGVDYDEGQSCPVVHFGPGGTAGPATGHTNQTLSGDHRQEKPVFQFW
jgi:hypothetical protein